ncbi:MAG: thymidine kinase [Granulosicoccaceae bacterium]
MAQLYFYYSAMNAGKSTALLQSAHNYLEQGMKVLLYTAAIDDRFGQGRIKSRIGLQAEASTFDAQSQLFDEIKMQVEESEIACVLVDEAQFLSAAQVDRLAAVVDQLEIPVLCYGIRTDFQGELFPGSSRLLAIADKLTELKTVCSCGRKATMVLRLDNAGQPVFEGGQVEIGGNGRYVSKCRRHYREAMQQFLSLQTTSTA